MVPLWFSQGLAILGGRELRVWGSMVVLLKCGLVGGGTGHGSCATECLGRCHAASLAAPRQPWPDRSARQGGRGERRGPARVP